MNAMRKNREKKVTVFALYVVLVGLFAISSCDKLRNLRVDEIIEILNDSSQTCDLVGTQWKLVGIVDVQSGVLKELDPKKCVKCYTLIFDTDSTFSTHSSTNELVGNYNVDCATHSFLLIDFGGTKINEMGDGMLYCNAFENMAYISDTVQFYLQKNKLRLYYNKNNYLFFEQL